MEPRTRRRKKSPSAAPISGPFLALPHSVLNSQAYLRLSFAAQSLLIDIAVQFNGMNNGHLLSSMRVLGPRRWRSSATVRKALTALEDAGLIYQTAQGKFPNDANLWAITWQALRPSDKFDPGHFEGFQKGRYTMFDPLPPIQKMKQAVSNADAVSSDRF
jgi:hypothetical protein